MFRNEVAFDVRKLNAECIVNAQDGRTKHDVPSAAAEDRD